MIDTTDPEASENRSENDGFTRRSVLTAASAGAVASITPFARGSKTGSGVYRTTSDTRSFDPAHHGFGFFNWLTQEGPYPGSVPSDAEVEPHSLREHWREPFEGAFDRPISSLPDRLLDGLANHARKGLLEITRTNGYCYGMVFAAQRYFEQPETIPESFTNASEITHPQAPLTTDRTPVLEDIIEYHAAQYLDFYAWFGRHAMMDPDRIDYDQQLRELTSVIDVYGTAGLTLFNAGTVGSHQVLVYDYDRRPDGLMLSVYDPNLPADAYANTTPTIEIDTTGSEPVVERIEMGSGYDHFVHNEYDRAIRARHETRNGSRSTIPNPLGVELFDGTLFVETNGPVEVTVLDPDGRPLDHTDDDRPLHYRYGAAPGTYTLQVTGQRTGGYGVEVYAGDHRRDLLDEALDGSITAGEAHRYEIVIGRDGGALADVHPSSDRVFQR